MLTAEEIKTAADTTAPITTTIEQKVQSLASMPVEEVIKTLTQYAVDVTLKILVALLIYFIGRWLIRYVLRMQKKMMDRRNVDPSLRVFLNNLIQISLIIILITIIVGALGIDTTSFVAIFASAGLAVGMALSGTLQNFAGGVMILALKPFRVGDVIEAQGQSGKVKEIRLFHTILNTADNKMILLPNGGISTSIINNYSCEPTRRVEWTFGIGYGDSYDRAKSIITKLLNDDKRILPTPGHMIALSKLDSSSVNIVVRAWVKSDDYWDLYYSLNEQVYKTFGESGINIPFPQLDVHIKN